MLSLKKLSVYRFSLLMICAVALSISCNKAYRDVKEKRIKEGNTIEMGAILPEIRETKNDTVKLALYPYAQFFFIDLGLKNSGRYVDLIKQANKANIPLRVKVFEDNRYEVAEIYPATAKDIENYNKSKSN